MGKLIDGPSIAGPTIRDSQEWSQPYFAYPPEAHSLTPITISSAPRMVW